MYKEYSKKSFYLLEFKGNEAELRNLGARWYKKLRTGDAGWVVPKTKENELRQILGLEPVKEPVEKVKEEPKKVKEEPKEVEKPKEKPKEVKEVKEEPKEVEKPKEVKEVKEEPKEVENPKEEEPKEKKTRREYLDKIHSHARPRKDQSKYHRSISASKYRSPAVSKDLEPYMKTIRTPGNEERLKPRAKN